MEQVARLEIAIGIVKVQPLGWPVKGALSLNRLDNAGPFVNYQTSCATCRLSVTFKR